MDRSVNPEMLVLARESRGLGQADLAEAVSASQGQISKFESGRLAVSDEWLTKISQVLDYPLEFFSQTERVYGFGSLCVFHRKRARVAARDLREMQARVNILRMQVNRLLRGVDFECEYTFTPMDVDEYGGSPERVAQLLRTSWKLPIGPVRGLIAAIEDAGGIVFSWPFKNKNIDALSQWPPGSPPLFFVNANTPADRMRHSLAHELGHVIMHASPGPDDLESQADRFAAEFLLPARDIGAELSPFSLQTAAALKPYWRASMAALIRRARDLGKITDRQYRSLFTQMSALGYRLVEPVLIAPEEPTLLRSMIDVHMREHGYSVADLSKTLVVNEEEFRSTYLKGAPPFRVVG